MIRLKTSRSQASAHCVFAIGAIIVVGLFSSKASAREGAGEWFEHQWQWAWLESYDPTLISRRVLTELSWEDSGDAESLTKLETSVRWAIPIREDLAFAIQGLVPLKWLDSAADRQFGLGDFEVRPGIVCRASRDLRFGFGVNAAFDTAPSSGLGSTVLELRPIAGVRWDASERINLCRAST